MLKYNQIKVADQGVRQKIVWPLNRSEHAYLQAGEVFTNARYPNKLEEQQIPPGCIGILHRNLHGETPEMSIVRDDCKAARKAIRACDE